MRTAMPAATRCCASSRSVLVANVRDSDCHRPLGGDEFGMLLSHADQEQAHKKADLLAEQVRTVARRLERQADSAQLCLWRVRVEGRRQCRTRAMARADEAMYAHKRG